MLIISPHLISPSSPKPNTASPTGLTVCLSLILSTHLHHPASYTAPSLITITHTNNRAKSVTKSICLDSQRSTWSSLFKTASGSATLTWDSSPSFLNHALYSTILPFTSRQSHNAQLLASHHTVHGPSPSTSHTPFTASLSITLLTTSLAAASASGGIMSSHLMPSAILFKKLQACYSQRDYNLTQGSQS